MSVWKVVSILLENKKLCNYEFQLLELFYQKLKIVVKLLRFEKIPFES